MVYRNSGKTSRPLYIEKAFEDIHNFTLQGLVVGMLFTVKGNNLANTKCFMKCAPAFVSKRYLREFGIDIEEYRENYLAVDNHATKYVTRRLGYRLRLTLTARLLLLSGPLVPKGRCVVAVVMRRINGISSGITCLYYLT